MPPKPKITKEMILAAALDITRETGFETVNARSIAGKLQCSTRPEFTCYENMDQLKSAFLEFAFAYYERYTAGYGMRTQAEPYLLLPLSYIAFAEEERNLFRLLFISDMALDMWQASDFYHELGNEEKANAFSRMIGVEPDRGKEIFLDLFLYSHGIAVLTATGKLSLRSCEIEQMLRNFLSMHMGRRKMQKEVSHEGQSISG